MQYAPVAIMSEWLQNLPPSESSRMSFLIAGMCIDGHDMQNHEGSSDAINEWLNAERSTTKSLGIALQLRAVIEHLLVSVLSIEQRESIYKDALASGKFSSSNFAQNQLDTLPQQRVIEEEIRNSWAALREEHLTDEMLARSSISVRAETK